MSASLATQRHFVISTRSSTAAAVATAALTATATTNIGVGPGTNHSIADNDTVAALGAATDAIETSLADGNVENNNSQPTTPHAVQDHDHDHEHEHFEFTTADDDDVVVAAAALEDVMTQKLTSNATTTSTEPQVEVIRVVMPMDASDSSNDAHLQATSMPGLSAIKDNVDLVQQVANGQVTVLQAQSTDGDDGTPQFITVTVSAQDAGQNYQVQYVDTELYHSNSSQTQMTYPFCPVGDYQTNGQAYYSATTAGNYAAATTNTPTSHASTLPYLVPVEESLLLNGSSQSHSRDSPQSLTHEVAYIHDAQSTPQTPTSTTTTNSISGGSIGTGGGGASPIDSEQSPLGSTNKIASATIKWLSRNYETADGVSLPRSTLYNHYIHHCNEHKLEPVNAASFGKLIRSVFSGLRTRRLGTRGNSKYHYYGIRIKPGSLLNQAMDEKSTNGYQTSNAVGGNSSLGNGALAQHGGVSSSAVSNGSMGQGSGGGGGAIGGHATRTAKKHTLKPETYEACIQYIGDGTGALPNIFPPIELNNSFNSELTRDDVETFRVMYREHCESFLDAVLNLEFSTTEFLLRDFWRATDNNNLDDCEEEKYLSKTKLYLLCHCAEVQKFVKEVDYQFYQNMVDVIIPDVLRSIPNALTQAIRNFAKNLEIWLCESTVGVPERMVQIKTSSVSAFCQTLRRYTSLNHLAQAARAVLQNSAQITQMLSDLNRVDFHNVQEQAAWVSQCEPSIVQRLESDFKTALQQQSSLEQWASWLQLVVESALEEYRGKPSYAKAARQFLLKWSFYSSMIIRDLTLRSASSFGSFHLIRLLFDEYMFYLVEHKIAEAHQKTAIAVICERMQKDIDFEFECQFEYITSESEHATSSTGNEAKRLKQE